MPAESSDGTDAPMRHTDEFLLQEIARSYPLYSPIQSVAIPTTTACKIDTERALAVRFDITAKNKTSQSSLPKAAEPGCVLPISP